MELDDKLKALHCMDTYGGGFASALAKAWLRADMHNHAKLYAAFGDLLHEYLRMANTIEKRGEE